MDQPGNAYEEFVRARLAEREKRTEERKSKNIDDVDRCDGVFRPCSRGDDDNEEYF